MRKATFRRVQDQAAKRRDADASRDEDGRFFTGSSCRDRFPQGPSIVTRLPVVSANRARLKLVSFRLVAIIRSDSCGALAMENRSTCPASSVFDVLARVRYTACPAEKRVTRPVA